MYSVVEGEIRFTEQEKIVWVAAILDGEGCFSLDSRDRCVRFRIACKMTDKDTIDRLAEFCGGTVTGPRVKPNRKPIFQWYLSIRIEVKSLIEKILPYMSIRRGEKIKLMLRVMKENPSVLVYTKGVGHGTRKAYESGCRCGECKASNTKRARKARARKACLPKEVCNVN